MTKTTICSDHNDPRYGLPLEENTDKIDDGLPVGIRGLDLKKNVDKLNAEKKAEANKSHAHPVKK